MSLETRDQEYMERSELATAREYAEIANSHDIPVTLFLTGKTVEEAPEVVADLAGRDHVEIGGHNYYAFGTVVHRAFRVLFGTWHGPRPVQRWEIDKTLDAFGDVGVNITAWRDHAYRQDRSTAALLAAQGVTHLSDAVGPYEPVRRSEGVTIVPINTPPDHEHVYHAFRTPGFVAAADFEDPFGPESHDVETWCDWVLDTVAARRDENRPATVLAHPACMHLADGFREFDRLCETLAADFTVDPISNIEA